MQQTQHILVLRKWRSRVSRSWQACVGIGQAYKENALEYMAMKPNPEKALASFPRLYMKLW
jgi:hypothetical protein